MQFTISFVVIAQNEYIPNVFPSEVSTTRCKGTSWNFVSRIFFLELIHTCTVNCGSQDYIIERLSSNAQNLDILVLLLANLEQSDYFSLHVDILSPFIRFYISCVEMATAS